MTFANIISAYYSENINTHDIMFTGSVIQLYQTYHPDQAWLPFASNVMFRKDPPVIDAANENSDTHIANLKRRVRRPIKVTNATAIYPTEREVEQYVLPFREFRAVTKKAFSIERRAHFPAWDRIDGRLLIYAYGHEDLLLVSKWCKTFCLFRYRCASNTVIFERERDAVMARLSLDLHSPSADDLLRYELI